MHTIGQRLKEWRGAQDLTQVEIATRLGLPMRTYQNYENDVRPPRTEGWAAFARAGINTNWLLTGEGPMLISDLDELQRARTRAAELQARLEQIEAARLAAGPAPSGINEPAMRAIITGVLEGTRDRGLSPAEIARRAVELYVRALAEELITPTGIGEGGRKSA